MQLQEVKDLSKQLSRWSPDGPDNSPGAVFLAISPTRAAYVKQFGMGGTDRWSSG